MCSAEEMSNGSLTPFAHLLDCAWGNRGFGIFVVQRIEQSLFIKVFQRLQFRALVEQCLDVDAASQIAARLANSRR